jgi:hypothetical protein
VAKPRVGEGGGIREAEEAMRCPLLSPSIPTFSQKRRIAVVLRVVHYSLLPFFVW